MEIGGRERNGGFSKLQGWPEKQYTLEGDNSGHNTILRKLDQRELMPLSKDME